MGSRGEECLASWCHGAGWSERGHVSIPLSTLSDTTRGGFGETTGWRDHRVGVGGPQGGGTTGWRDHRVGVGGPQGGGTTGWRDHRVGGPQGGGTTGWRDHRVEGGGTTGWRDHRVEGGGTTVGGPQGGGVCGRYVRYYRGAYSEEVR